MNDSLCAAIQGVVEGLTEFLPVSSTAHIRIAQELLGVPLDDPYWKMFAVVIQLGAILAVVAYFWKRLFAFLRSFLVTFAPPSPVDLISESLLPMAVEKKQPNRWLKHPFALVGISFLVTAIPCFLIDKFIGEWLEKLPLIAVAMIVGGIAMYLIDLHFDPVATTTEMESMTLKQAIVIGLFQILAAAFPGTSRSMATIAGGQIMGLSRSVALEFSFFLSIPVMFAAAGFKLLQFVLREPIPMTGDQTTTLAIGFVTSFAVAFVVIAWFMGWVRKHGFGPFAAYRIVAGTAILVWKVWIAP